MGSTMTDWRQLRSLIQVIVVLMLAGACGSAGVSGSITTELADVAGSDGLPRAVDQGGDDQGGIEGSAACLPDEPECGDTLVAEPEVQDLPNTSPGEDRSAELIGQWEIVNYELPDGGLTNVVGSEPVFIEFGADGSVRYHTGCNSGGSEYTTSGSYVVPESALDDAVEGQPLRIGPLFEQTEEGCDGFLGEQDVDLPANMNSVTRFIFRDGILRSGCSQRVV